MPPTPRNTGRPGNKSGRRPRVAGTGPRRSEPLPAESGDVDPSTVSLEKPTTTEPVESEVVESDVESGPGSSRRSGSTPLFALCGVLLIAAVVALIAFLQPGVGESSNSAFVDRAATDEVVSATTAAMQTVLSYKVDTIDQDQDAARAVLDTDRLAEYNSTADQTKEAVQQTQAVVTATITDIGVASLQGDRAELVVNTEVAANQEGVDQGLVDVPAAVSMHRVDGKWLISAIANR